MFYVLKKLSIVTGMLAVLHMSFGASAQDKPLTLEDVLASSVRNVPEILMEIAEKNEAAGYAQAAQGAFDVNLGASGFSRATGFWSGSVVELEAKQNIGVYGAQVYGKYRISDGRFPIYEDEYFTNTLGEFKVGTLFSLLRNKDIDENRFNIRDTALAQKQAETDILFQKIIIQQQATQAYWNWVVTGHQYDVYRQLLQIANERQKALEIQVKEGAVADIFILENRQNITRREKLVTEAKQRFQTSAIMLSYYLRNKEGTTRLPEAYELPDVTVFDQQESVVFPLILRPGQLLQNRPELQQLKLAIERLNQTVNLRENDLAPQLDLSLELSRDFGSIAEGGSSRASTDTVVGLQFSISLGQRKAKGKLTAAKAKRKALRQKTRMVQDKIQLELKRVTLDLKVSAEMLELAKQETRQSRLLADAEQMRFQNGASDFFLLNIREERATTAQIEELKAHLVQRISLANFYAASMNLQKLGLF
ncbi:TolC family protein [Kordiimonas laminariae]|uniref:TolC family protein n=1 Tax=Kordiimonas laminariae TaxID=2917717 RepID=UPI001FF6262D|nr:TolC family protein [Kordiimonas laminariae]MCK0070846.1 TolC family protein [Kordiimonas laminariae]